MSMPTIFDLLAKLRSDLAAATDDALWSTVEQIETQVSLANRPDERDALRQLKSAMSSYMHSRREGHGDGHRAALAIAALETIAKRGAVGLDGWPMA